MESEFLLGAVATVFAIVNPIGNVPFFQAVTEGYSHEDRRRVAVKTCLVLVCVLAVFAVFGNWIFEVYNITIPAFRIAGGILLFSIAFSMLHGQKSRTKISEEERAEALGRDEVGIVPLGIPMFAGPGSITTIMILVSDASSSGGDALPELAAIAAAVLITAAASFLLLTYSDKVFGWMGRSGANAFSRIMGLLLSAVAVNIVLTGIAGALPLYGIT